MPMRTTNRIKAAALLFSLVVTVASASPPLGGDIYVSAPPLLVKINADGIQSVVLTSIITPKGVVFDQTGNIYVADSTTNSVIKITPDGTESIFAIGLANPKDLALDAAGNLYVANSGTNSILKIAPDGTKTTFASNLNGPTGLAFDATGNLFVSSSGADAIFEITPDGSKSTFVSAGLNAPSGLAFDALGNLLVADTGSDSILKVDRNGTVTVDVATGLDAPADVSVDALGNLIVADTGSNSILKITPGGTITPVVTGLIAPISVAMAPGLHQLLNISTRGFVETGNHVLIGGFIVRGTPEADLGQTNVLVRAIGPSIDSSDVPDPLLDTVLELRDSTGALIATNDDWMDTQKSEIQATGLAPTDNRESAIRATLPDGNYTAIVRGANDTIGVALVEVYKLQ